MSLQLYFHSSVWLTAVSAAVLIDRERPIASPAFTSQHDFLALAKIGAIYNGAVTWMFANSLTDVDVEVAVIDEVEVGVLSSGEGEDGK
jgi:hypothetical protein